jgi:hypothetical protein
MVGCAAKMGARRGVLHSWRPKVAQQIWARDPCPPFPPQILAAMSSPPASSEHQARAVRAAFACCPSLYQQRAQEQARRPSKVALHSPRVVNGLYPRENSRGLRPTVPQAGQGLASRNSREGWTGDAAWLPAPFGTCGTPEVHLQCISSCTTHAAPPAPRPGSVGWRRASGAHGGRSQRKSPNFRGHGGRAGAIPGRACGERPQRLHEQALPVAPPRPRPRSGGMARDGEVPKCKKSVLLIKRPFDDEKKKERVVKCPSNGTRPST